MKFKEQKMSEEFHGLDHMLRMILVVMESVYKNLGKDFVITEVKRKPRHANDLHAYNRAADVRTRNLSKSEIDFVSRLINRAFVYDPDRLRYQVALHHDVGLGAHFHVQVHPRTFWSPKGLLEALAAKDARVSGGKL